MQISQHADQRMNQRGISRRLVEFTLRHGRVEGDKHVRDRSEARRIIEALTEELQLAKRIMDKGGVTVVEDQDTVITAYNVNAPMHAAAGRAERPLSEERRHV
ncbi:MAG TPA: DUF4258 domain-containing protein [Steroidobacteraceae bacterium]|nr:DUF4258 domain-containing protein [Steroidobacteraceae bacterium]